jgi:UDP-N-acetylmuramyl pentapeptide synthase
LIDDSYNANPESVIAAAQVLSDVPRGTTGGRTIFVLGDMLEMGEHSEELHREVGREIARVARPDMLVTVGAAARAAGMRLPASCTKGLCGTCKSRLVSGQVEMKHAGGIRHLLAEGLAAFEPRRRGTRPGRESACPCSR